jgi:hypothetical protein
MERLKLKIWLLGAGMAVLATVIAITPSPNQGAWKETKWRVVHPTKVGAYSARLLEPASATNRAEMVTYEQDKVIYDTLVPAGICSRIFSGTGGDFEVVAIASRNKESFHDPQVCMSAQGWVLSNERVEMAKTRTRGDVPVTMVDMESEGGEKVTALYFVKTTQGYFSDLGKVKLAMFTYKWKNLGKSDDGVFVRIIPQGMNDPAKLLRFAGIWIDEAVKTSQNWY